MRICPNCRSEVDDNFDICWNCQYSFTDERVLSKSEFSETCPYCNVELSSSFEYCPNCQKKLGLNSIPSDPSSYVGESKVDCIRCKIPMIYKGNFRFDDGPRFGAFGNLNALFTNIESLNVYYCPNCGKIEFFMPMEEQKSEDL
jgi:hypothetical protein